MIDHRPRADRSRVFVPSRGSERAADGWSQARQNLSEATRGEFMNRIALKYLRVVLGALAVLLLTSIPLPAQTHHQHFSIPQWTSMRIRMDDTITSRDSEVGDPFSATVVDQGDYQDARVYGTIRSITQSGHIKGNTEMVFSFNRLMMPDGRRASIDAEI